MTTNTIRFKISILFSAILAVILIIYSSYLFYTVRRTLYNDLHRDLQLKAEQVVGILKAYSGVRRLESEPLYLIQRLSENRNKETNRDIIDDLWEMDVESLRLDKDYFRLINNRGDTVLRSKNLSEQKDIIFRKSLALNFKNVYFTDIMIDGRSMRAINYPFLVDQDWTFILQIATSTKTLNSVINGMILFMTGGILTIIVFSSFMGAFLTGRILKPVNIIRQAADNISQKDLGIRIQEKEVDQELKLLIDSFNKMLGRLENAFSHINQFSSHVAHELKTPLAVVKGEMELVLSEEHEKSEYKKVIQTALKEVDRLIKIIKDLLLLAKFDYKPEIFKFEALELTGFLKELHEHSRILAAEKHIQLHSEIPDKGVFIEADTVHLRRLFFNLIHNAVKFTPRRGEILIRLSMEENMAVISVKDTGEGIRDEDLEKIFDKFYRVNKSNEVSEHQGTGLGLSMAQSIVKAHNGEITVESKLGEGTTFIIRLPLIGRPAMRNQAILK